VTELIPAGYAYHLKNYNTQTPEKASELDYEGFQSDVCLLIRDILNNGHQVLIMHNSDYPEAMMKVLENMQLFTKDQLAKCIILGGYRTPQISTEKYQQEHIACALKFL